MVKASDWIKAGYALLRKDGSERLTIDRLCKALEKTKGSFYHHFADISAYEDALLSAWKEAHTLAPIEIADARASTGAEPSVVDRRRALYRAVGKLDMKLELAIRAWAASDPRARRAQIDVDATRVAYLGSLWGRGKRAQANAELEYAAFLGLLHQHGDTFPEYTHLMALLLQALSAE